jgi:hypothetical protein
VQAWRARDRGASWDQGPYHGRQWGSQVNGPCSNAGRMLDARALVKAQSHPCAAHWPPPRSACWCGPPATSAAMPAAAAMYLAASLCVRSNRRGCQRPGGKGGGCTASADRGLEVGGCSVAAAHISAPPALHHARLLCYAVQRPQECAPTAGDTERHNQPTPSVAPPHRHAPA